MHPDRRIYAFGPFRIDSEERLLFRGDELIPLTPKVVDTLLALLSSDGRIVEKDDLVKAVWPDSFVEEGGLARNISMLRKTLGGAAGDAQFIETIPKRGYRFVAPLKAGAGEGLPARAAPAGRRFWPWIAACLLVVLAAGGAYFLHRRASNGAQRFRSLIVLPLKNLSGDASQDYIADGMTADVINNLMKIEALRVVSDTTAMTYKGANKRLPQIAREQNVDVVVEGSVQRFGQRWEINVQLFDAADQPLWSGTYPGDLRDVLSLASNAARSIAEEIRVKMTPSEKQRLASARQVDPEAWLDYSYGRWYWNKRTTEGILGAIDHFQRAIAKDPKFAPAYSGLADAYALLGSAGVDAKRPLEVMPKAKQAALEAVKWDPLLAEGHTSLGYVRLSYDWDLDAARSEFERAIALNPGYATAYQWYAHYWLAMAQPEKALAAAREAQARDPYSLVINVSVGWCLYHGRRYGEAIEQYQAALKMGPEFALGHAVLGMAYEESRRFPEAIDEFGKALDRGSRSLALAGLGSAHGLAGRPADARKVLDQLQRIAVHEYVPAAYVAAIYAAMGDKDRGIEWTRKAFDERSDYMVYLRTEPWADSLRSDPRFRQIVESVASAKAP